MIQKMHLKCTLSCNVFVLVVKGRLISTIDIAFCELLLVIWLFVKLKVHVIFFIVFTLLEEQNG